MQVLREQVKTLSQNEAQEYLLEVMRQIPDFCLSQLDQPFFIQNFNRFSLTIFCRITSSRYS
ncbi:hypothetical protein [Microcoleus anatoxicus]|uniref:hypothetical protein n=1 Tax=Microcoleus anatoxicus TaxID=2705319 RepID=UPI003BF513D3